MPTFQGFLCLQAKAIEYQMLQALALRDLQEGKCLGLTCTHHCWTQLPQYLRPEQLSLNPPQAAC